MNFIEMNNQTEIMSDMIEQKIVKILLNNTKLRQLLLNNQLISNKELEDISILGIIILVYILAILVTYYFMLLYTNLFSENKSSTSKESRTKRRKTLKKSTKDSIDSIIQDFKDNSTKFDNTSLDLTKSTNESSLSDEIGRSGGISDSLVEINNKSNKPLRGTKKRKTIIRTP